ncbi:MAG: long-chain fatty acid--CoA ligase [Actinomycetaceae bacterium]|nr:long-chain fatty acid--CoA ligase [Actinomycetaceae bacterium]MDU0969537.1 long-chain fatty acid--CoA ligase [Actinomycetaceae bacterium]
MLRNTHRNESLLVSPTVVHAIMRRAKYFPTEIAVERPAQLGHAWVKTTAKELADDIINVGRGFTAMGLAPRDTVAILAATSYEWMLIDLGAQAAGLIVVPIYETDSDSQIHHILSDSAVRVAITDTTLQARRITSQACDDPNFTQALALADGALEHLLEIGASVPPQVVLDRLDDIDPAEPMSIVYTSGTTGIPKGVEITPNSMMHMLEAVREPWGPLIYDRSTARVLLFLPVAHVLARFISYQMLVGHGVAGYTRSAKTLLNDLATFKPYALLVVPRVLEKIFNVADTQAGSSKLTLRVFRWAVRVGEEWARASETPEGPTRKQKRNIQIARMLVFNKVRKMLGGNLVNMTCGGAPLSPRVGYFFTAMGVEVTQGYGSTECTGPLTMARRDNNIMGSVGEPLACNEVKIAEDGELLARGASIMRGYHNDPEATAAAFTEDGWYKTGDLGSIDDHGRVWVTGRKREIIVTAGGKNVTPAPLEESLKAYPLISQVMVVGDNRPFVGALVTLDRDMLPAWLKNHGLPPMDVTRAARNPKVLAALDRAVERTNESVSRAESIRKIRVLSSDFTEDNGLLTPSQKIKRPLITERFAAEIDEIYSEPTNSAK